MVTIAHVSDTHLDCGERARSRAEAVMALIEALAPDAVDVVLHTGDVTDHATPEEYVEARRILTVRTPALITPGNHDGRAEFREGLLDEQAAETPVNQLHTIKSKDGTEAVLAVCDSSIPGRDDGRLTDDTLAWLEAALSETAATTPVLIAFHHPPVVLGLPYVDEIRLRDPEALEAVIRAHPNVVGVLCGHAHTPASAVFAGRPLVVAGGISSTLMLPFEPGAEALVDLDAPPVIAFHVLERDQGQDSGWRLVSHHRVVPIR